MAPERRRVTSRPGWRPAPRCGTSRSGSRRSRTSSPGSTPAPATSRPIRSVSLPVLHDEYGPGPGLQRLIRVRLVAPEHGVVALGEFDLRPGRAAAQPPGRDDHVLEAARAVRRGRARLTGFLL